MKCMWNCSAGAESHGFGQKPWGLQQPIPPQKTLCYLLWIAPGSLETQHVYTSRHEVLSKIAANHR